MRPSAWLLAAAALAVAGLVGVVRHLGPERERDRWIEEGWSILRGSGRSPETGDRPGLALWAFDRAEAALGGDPQVAQGRARALAAMGAYAESLEAWSSAAAAGVEEPDAWRTRWWHPSPPGDVAWGNLVEAVPFLTALAEEAARAGDTETATRASLEARRRMVAPGQTAPPDDLGSLVLQARLLLASGDGEASQEALARALDLLPEGTIPLDVGVQMARFLDRVEDPELVARVLAALGREDVDSADLSPEEIQRRVIEALGR